LASLEVTVSALIRQEKAFQEGFKNEMQSTLLNLQGEFNLSAQTELSLCEFQLRCIGMVMELKKNHHFATPREKVSLDGTIRCQDDREPHRVGLGCCYLNPTISLHQ
jgi:hypothetical protein